MLVVEERRKIFIKYLNKALTIFEDYRGITPVNSDRFQKKQSENLWETKIR